MFLHLINAARPLHTQLMEVHPTMGEFTIFNQGDRAPNDGTYIETGVNSYHMGIQNPKKVSLHKGERFPDNTNHERKWIRMPK
jgi:hypothetical protein